MTDALSRLGDWKDLAFFSESYPAIAEALRAETRPILPAPDRIFAALELTPRDATRVVILGQDPYPTPGHANGLAFSVAPEVTPLPRSLSNIYKELRDDLGATPATGDLTHWARQGVLLLNTALTVPAGAANGHRDLGWSALADEVMATVSRARPTAFLLWGAAAHRRTRHLHGSGHLVIETAHPSPLSARRGFFGSKPFSRINQWLTARDMPAIDWSGPGKETP